MPEGIHQPPVLESLQPLPFLRQEAALSGTQPALGIGLADADVAVLWRDVQITHHHDPLGGIEVLLQMGLEVRIESGLGGELDRVVPALALGEISIEHDQRLAIGTGQGGADHPALCVLAVIRKALAYPQGFITGQQRNAVMAFLAMIMHVIAQLLHRLEGKLLIIHLGFLQPDHGGRMLIDQLLQLMRSGAQAIDVERNYFHVNPIEKTRKGQIGDRPFRLCMVAFPQASLMCSRPWPPSTCCHP
jgi:hypothetical protein